MRKGQYTENCRLKRLRTLKLKKEFGFYIIPTLCACGCREIIWWPGGKFKCGHNTKTPYHRQFISNVNTGKIRSEKFKQNLSELNKRLGKTIPQPTDRPAWNWKGGLSFLPYCSKFNNKLKEAVRNRDNYTCQLCGTKQEELAGRTRHLSIHHIHYDKENCYPDLIALCQPDNSKVNSNRKHYEELFMNKLNDRGLLFWTVSLYKEKDNVNI